MIVFIPEIRRFLRRWKVEWSVGAPPCPPGGDRRRQHLAPGPGPDHGAEGRAEAEENSSEANIPLPPEGTSVIAGRSSATVGVGLRTASSE